jgi:hypothetical protein
MFTEVADTETLRQGDIFRDMVFPVISTSRVQFLVTSDPGDARRTFTVNEATVRNAPEYSAQFPIRIGFAVMITQCCDLEPRNGRIEQPTLALARFLPVPEGISRNEEQLVRLRLNADPRLPESGFLNMFHIPAVPILDGKEWIVDFGSVFCISNREYPSVMRHKILQMDDNHRIRFKIRLMSSFGRFTEEEKASGHPWLPPPVVPNT